LDFEDLTKVEFAFWPGEAIPPHVHPPANGSIGLLGTLIVET
jgi:quercetin dioxygenase-like cupin family protein